ncbi:MAG: response regulator transcription factor [Chloracidobacterium sp.]|uniref:Response regulator transcription factor n=1 Tax=Chloracidobacterium validum TaxID=2821543 RepID=A0ABX8BB79_9BACT|nr:response regulator transcription factor [Chloracidobacterium validum]QUW02325.1 response regulator transcription factor [Chloracidobacterium validum]
MSILRHQTILFIGSDSETGQLIEKTLSLAGYQVTVFPDPDAARPHCNPPPTLVIVDTTPGIGELAPARLMREQLVTTPIIALTRLPDEVLSRAMERLRLSSLVKPVTPALLLATVADEIEWAENQGTHTRITSPLETLEISEDLVLLLSDPKLAPRLDVPYRRTPALEAALEAAHLSPSNIALFDLFDGQSTLADILAGLPHIEPKILLLATYLVRVGWLVPWTGPLSPDKVSTPTSESV